MLEWLKRLFLAPDPPQSGVREKLSRREVSSALRPRPIKSADILDYVRVADERRAKCEGKK